MIIKYNIHQVSEYINWIYFFHAWGFAPKFATIADIHDCKACQLSWIAQFQQEEKEKAEQARKLYKDAVELIEAFDKEFHTYAICELFDANSEDDNIIIGDTTFPLLRQQTKGKEVFLSLSDFIRPASHNIKDRIGIFATTVDKGMEHLFEDDGYMRMLAQTVADRLAEATAEKAHEYVRKELWGYAKEENFTPKELFNEKYQGIRPAVGYPSLPDQSVNFIIDELINLSLIGISLTENGMMIPHASVSGLMISHPKAIYFSIGAIDENQLIDYAKRRGLTIEKAKKYLSANI